MNVFHQYTPLRFAAAFLAGIIPGIYFLPQVPPGVAILLMAGIWVFYLFAAAFLQADYTLRWLPGLAALAAFVFSGLACVSLHDAAREKKDHAIIESSGESLALCRVSSSVSGKGRSFGAEAVVLAICDGKGPWIGSGAGVIIYFGDDSTCVSLKFGDVILVEGRPSVIAGPGNPHAFDYRKYLHNKGIGWQLNTVAGRWHATGKTAGSPVRRWASHCRDWFMLTLARFGVEGGNMALAAALLLGTKEYLDREVKQEFSYAGAMHVLCVSGLHVGIMYVIAGRLLFFLKRGRKGKMIQPWIILLFIWAYAFITGLAPSVMRAGLMFSFLTIGRALKRDHVNFNILAVSAFSQLMINPYEITQVGFQLSYLAVAGIFAFYRPLNMLAGRSNPAVAWVWSTVAVSVSAQLATTPLACMYFGIFPVYFLLTNLVVVPLAGVIIYLALALVIFGATGIYAMWLALPLQWSLQFMQGAVNWIQAIPGSVITDIYLHPVAVAVIYASISGLYFCFVLRRRDGLFIVLLAALALSIVGTIVKSNRSQVTELAVYQVSGHTAIDLIHARQVVFIRDSLLAYNPGLVDSRISPNRLHHGIKHVEEISPDTVFFHPRGWAFQEPPFVFFHGYRMAIISKMPGSTGLPDRVKLDALILSGRNLPSPGKLLSVFDPSVVIIDGTVPRYLSRQIMDHCMAHEIPCHSVRNDGAYVIRRMGDDYLEMTSFR